MIISLLNLNPPLSRDGGGAGGGLAATETQLLRFMAFRPLGPPPLVSRGTARAVSTLMCATSFRAWGNSNRTHCRYPSLGRFRADDGAKRGRAIWLGRSLVNRAVSHRGNGGVPYQAATRPFSKGTFSLFPRATFSFLRPPSPFSPGPHFPF